MSVYYNEFNKKKCAALKALMEDGHISPGDIDDRPIQEVKADDLKGYTRCPFFAGIGLWDCALDLAGWPHDAKVWTGSCPCQPFSSAGRQKGKADDRHLWPKWERLIEECRPPVVFGEQVASAIAHGWLDDVYQGLEAQGYAVGSAVLPACSVGAPHKRDRLWFVADCESSRWEQRNPNARGSCQEQRQVQKRSGFTNGCCNVANPKCSGLPGQRKLQRSLCAEADSQWQTDWTDHAVAGNWQDGIWIDCSDGKKRLIEPGICLLADRYPERVGLLHCAGDAIVAQVAAEFIRAFKEAKILMEFV